MVKRVHRIDKVLRKTLRKMDLDTKLEGYRIWSLWPDIVGDQVARKTQPERLRNRILFVRVSSSTWMQQLQTMKPMLLERIHKRLKGGVIKDIRFSLGTVVPPTPASSELQPKAEPQEIRLSAEMEGYLDQIGDSELRTLMRNVLLKQAGRIMRGEEA
jgi:predicted nucleic acid-binding Zn ribbon protein